MKRQRAAWSWVALGSFLVAGTMSWGQSAPVNDSRDPLGVWHRRTNAPTQMKAFVTVGGQILGGDDKGFVHTSIDGVRWTARFTGTPLPIVALAHGDGRFVALAGSREFLVSTNGVDWSHVAPVLSRENSSIVYAQGVFTVGAWTDSYIPLVLRSTNGLEWSVRTIGTNGIIRGVAYANGLYVAAGFSTYRNGGVIMTSPDGEHWTTQPAPVPGINGLAAGGGAFVGVSGINIVRSTNGTDWTTRQVLDSVPIFYNVVFADGNFITTGETPVLATSRDGLEWVRRDSGTPAFTLMEGVGAIGGRVVIGGSVLLQSDPSPGAPPLLMSAPVERVQRIGTIYTNRVEVEYPDPVTYQWLFNGTPITGATNQTLIRSNVTESMSGDYSLIVSADGGASVTSTVASAVFARPARIVVHPLSQEVVAGGSVTLSVVVSGTPPFAFRWRQSGSTYAFSRSESEVSFLPITNLLETTTFTVVVSNVVTVPGELSQTATLTVMSDADRDGVPDAYEARHGLNVNDPTDASQDADGDGATNGAEYVAGTDPRDAESFLRVEQIDGKGGATLEFAIAAGRTCAVEFTENLDTGLWSSLVDLPAQPISRRETVTDPAPFVRRFYRLVIPVRR